MVYLQDLKVINQTYISKIQSERVMTYSLVIGILSLIGGLLAMMLVKDLIWLLRSIKYIKQGIPVRYFPFLGYAKHLDNPEKEIGQEDLHQLFQNPKNKNQTEKLIMTNGPKTEPTIFLNDKDLIKEFFQKETQVSYTDNTIAFPAAKAFTFDIDPHSVQKARAIYAEIFFPKNLKKHTPQIRAIIQRHLDRIKQEIKQKTEGNNNQPEIEVKRFLKDIFEEMVSFILFGGEIPKLDGVILVNQIDKVIGGFFNNMKSPLNILTLGVSTKLGLDSEFNQIKELYRRIIEVLIEVIKKRDSSEDYEFGSNAVDLLILKKRQLEAQGKADLAMTYEVIAQNVFTMIFAGVDTTRNLTESSLYHLSKEKELQQQLRETIRKEVLDTGRGEDYDKYDNSPMLDMFIAEALRVYTPASMSFHRKISKTFKLGQYTIYKGDHLIVSYVTVLKKPELFGRASRFDLEKYEDTKRIKDLSKSALIPFSVGKRACIGKNLADIMVKMILSNFLDQFELEKSNEPNRRFMEFTVGLKHCRARVRSLN